MFVMDDVVNAVDRHDVTGFINGLSQRAPPSWLSAPVKAKLKYLMPASGFLVVLGIFARRQMIGAIRYFRPGPR